MSRNQKEDGDLLPLYNVLTESLNVELVYIILKSITRFAYLHNNQEGRKSIDLKKKGTMTSIHLESSDEKIKLSNIKIKDPMNWAINNNNGPIDRTSSTTSEDSQAPDEPLIMKKDVDVTFHRMSAFTDIFREFY